MRHGGRIDVRIGAQTGARNTFLALKAKYRPILQACKAVYTSSILVGAFDLPAADQTHRMADLLCWGKVGDLAHGRVGKGADLNVGGGHLDPVRARFLLLNLPGLEGHRLLQAFSPQLPRSQVSDDPWGGWEAIRIHIHARLVGLAHHRGNRGTARGDNGRIRLGYLLARLQRKRFMMGGIVRTVREAVVRPTALGHVSDQSGEANARREVGSEGQEAR